MAVEILASVLCDLCSNVGRGVKLPGKTICLDCASDDPALVEQIVRVSMPEFAEKYDAILKQAGDVK
jgi:hypothetical protein